MKKYGTSIITDTIVASHIKTFLDIGWDFYPFLAMFWINHYPSHSQTKKCQWPNLKSDNLSVKTESLAKKICLSFVFAGMGSVVRVKGRQRSFWTGQ